jgi:beta-galactosidase
MIETRLRPTVDLAEGWEFFRGRVGGSWLRGLGSGGEVVDLPHSWNAADTFQVGRTSYSGWGAYRRAFASPQPPASDGSSWRLRTGGFYGIGDVWLDGHRLARVDGQYLGVSIDLPPLDGEAEHLLAFRLDNRWRRDVLPGFRQPDFILHGGLAGGVWLERVPVVAFDLDRTVVECERQPSGDEMVTLRSAISGSSSAVLEAVLEWTVTGPDVGAVASARSRASVRHDRPTGTPPATALTIREPQCWSPDHPSLYRAEGRLTLEGREVDAVGIRFGITRAEFRPRQGFFLDGVRVDLHGCNRHQAIPGFGNALPDVLQRRDALILKELGCNFVRLSHYPQSPVFLDACDELGIMVYAEIATWKSVRSARGWRRAARRQMHDLIVRDRHHPSVILWGMGNESRSRKAYLELRSIARELDPERPVIYAENHLYRARRERTVGIPDVWGVNYELDALETGYSSSRLENVVVSECCNHPQSVRGDDQEELLQVATVENDWERMAEVPYVAGHAVWCLADYATEHRGRFRRLPGLCDAWRRPKMAAELFRARFSERPFVSLFVTTPGPAAAPSRFRREHRVDGGGQAALELHAFTNCETLRIARDGAMMAFVEGAIHHVLPLYGNFFEIIATGSHGAAVVQASVRRHGEAERIHIRPPAGTITSPAELDIEILDGSNVVACGWNGIVRLTVDGPGRAHALNEAHEVPVARGVGRAYLSLSEGREPVVVTAAADGLSPGILSVELQESLLDVAEIVKTTKAPEVP